MGNGHMSGAFVYLWKRRNIYVSLKSRYRVNSCACGRVLKMAAVRSSSPGADSSHSSTAAVSERLRTEDGSESEKHSRMTALLERLHGKHNSSRSWQETSKVVRQAMEKRGVINTAGHQLLLNCLETLQRALKVSSLPSMTDRLESIARQNMLGSHLSPSRTECYITSDMFYVEVHLDKAGKLVDVKVAHHGENPVSCPELIQHLSDKDISSRREYRDPLHEADRHSECIACLGSAHTEAAFTGTECFHCESMSLTLLRLWIAFFHRGGPPQPALLFPHSQEPRRKKQQSSRVPSGSSDLTPTQSTSLFPQHLAFAFLDFPVSPKGLFAPAMDGFAERFMAAQKSSQAMRHFLPKCSSLVAASSRQKATSTHQPAKAAPSTTQPPPRSEPGLVQTFQVAKLNPFPKRQGPRPHVTLGPEPQKPS